MSETAAGQVALTAEQLHLTMDRLHQIGVTVHDLREIARYLDTLADHGQALCGLALRAIGHADETHPVRNTTHGIDLQASISHARNLLDAAMHFACDARQALNDMTGDPS